jgi:hypothetical protein
MKLLTSFSLTLTLLLSSVGFISASAEEQSSAKITGVVQAATQPIAGVVVSDGVNVVKTDAEGRYELLSDKQNGYVFISIPSGYEVPSDGAFPLFWQPLTEATGVDEQHDFNLVQRDNNRFALFAISDLHLARQQNDIEQLCIGFVPHIQQHAKQYADRPIYSLNMGDSSWDSNWYAHHYGLDEYRKTINIIGYPTQIFHMMGNHDNDGAVAAGPNTDFEGSAPFRRYIGPNNYSFNLGQIHVVVLDNIYYKNEPTTKAKAEGIVGSRNYEARVTPEQLEWLRRDLATVADKSVPIILATHAPMFRYEGLTGKVLDGMKSPGNSEDVLACFEGFSDIHILTGHSHANNTTRVREGVIEHNIGAICGALWRTGAVHNQQINVDGSPCGYTVFEIDGTKLNWRYETIAYGDYQFRTYDMNEVAKYYQSSEKVADLLEHYPLRLNYGKDEADQNDVFIYVWGWEPAWKISVKENGVELPAERRAVEDPLLTISYDIPQSVDKGKYSKDFSKGKRSSHIFVVKASSPTSTLQIEVTDSFGRVYRETMERPKAFGLRMN